MQQQPVTFSRAVFATALTIVVLLVSGGIGVTWLTIRHQPLQPSLFQLRGGGEQPRAIEGVYQTLIEHDETTAHDRQQAMTQLSSYGWVDRSRGIIHIPIARAMEMVAKEAR